MPLPSFLKRGLPLFILAAALGGYALLKATRPPTPAVERQERIWQVTAQTVSPAAHAPLLPLYGRIEAPDMFRAAAPLASRVRAVHVRDGQKVAAGTLLLELEADDFAPRLAQAEADVKELEAQIQSEKSRFEADKRLLESERRLLELARADLSRNEALQKRDLGARAQIDTARQSLERQQLSLTTRELAITDHPARLAQLEARLARAEAKRDEARRDLERSRVSAPFDAVIARVDTAAGAQVNANQTLLVAYPREGLELRAKLPAAYVDELATALAQGVSLSAHARLDGKRLPLRLKRIAGEGDARGVDALFTLLGEHPGARLGALLNVELERPVVTDSVLLPHSALYGNGRVYRIAQGRLEAIDIERLGETRAPDGQPLFIARSPSLRDGDLILTTHLPNALSGLSVNVVEGLAP